ncbi:MAG: hypothetical protein AAGA77_12615 [Bacteroidota bacterium]
MKKQYQINGKGFSTEWIELGGEANWLQFDETPIDPEGKPKEFLAEFGWGEAQFYLFYSNKYKLAVQLYQIT